MFSLTKMTSWGPVPLSVMWYWGSTAATSSFISLCLAKLYWETWMLAAVRAEKLICPLCCSSRCNDTSLETKQKWPHWPLCHLWYKPSREALIPDKASVKYFIRGNKKSGNSWVQSGIEWNSNLLPDFSENTLQEMHLEKNTKTRFSLGLKHEWSATAGCCCLHAMLHLKTHTQTRAHTRLLFHILIVKQMAGIVPFSEKSYTSHNLIGQSDLNIQDDIKKNTMRLQLKVIINFNTATSYLKIWWLHITTHLSCKEVKFCKQNSEITVRMSCCAHFCNELPPNVKALQKRAKYKQQRVASAAQAWLIYKPRPVLLYVHVCFLFNIISAKRCAYLHVFDMLGHRNATCHHVIFRH